MKLCPPLDPTVTASTRRTKAPGSGSFPAGIRLSRGDRIAVEIPDGAEFNGDYVVGPDGRIALPFGVRVEAAGRTEEQLAEAIRRGLIRQSQFSRDLGPVSVRLVKYGPLQVSVSGAVFQPGFVTINDADEKGAIPAARAFGDTAVRRNLTAAIREASGARPDADLSRVEVIRGGRSTFFDLRGAVTGEPVVDPALADGDRVVIHSAGCFFSDLVRPSAVTPRGIRIYVSKIHIGPDARYDEKIPFGLRLLQGAIIASCVGGNLATDGRRQVVLVSINPITKATEVVQRPVEHLLRDQHRDDINPLLMPDDAIACYDSTVREAVGVAGALGTIANSITSIVNAQRALSNQK
ncbi:MAG TPA: polysaccharide biosynthesis/export family protein [Hyphomicrobiaceae bacterium]|nr:polysaccharide biosynthesis/export family protein [Hyphomicrobiaceae bacterium]